ncbi:MAG: hypothetical protein AAFS10_25030 [Myxococcota bacterium]
MTDPLHRWLAQLATPQVEVAAVLGALSAPSMVLHHFALLCAQRALLRRQAVHKARPPMAPAAPPFWEALEAKRAWLEGVLGDNVLDQARHTARLISDLEGRKTYLDDDGWDLVRSGVVEVADLEAACKAAARGPGAAVALAVHDRALRWAAWLATGLEREERAHATPEARDRFNAAWTQEEAWQRYALRELGRVRQVTERLELIHVRPWCLPGEPIVVAP